MEEESTVLSVIINRYAEANPGDTQSDTDKEEQEEEIRQIKYVEAIAALDLLNLFKKQQDSSQIKVIRKLNAIKATIH